MLCYLNETVFMSQIIITSCLIIGSNNEACCKHKNDRVLSVGFIFGMEWRINPSLDKYKDNKNWLIHLMLLDLFLIKNHTFIYVGFIEIYSNPHSF